jgi:uncharacterized protein YndB with AHSA1/START domain
MSPQNEVARAGTGQEQAIVIRRTLAAPRELVFSAWTSPEHFVKWWGPQGYTAPYCTIDLRPGGELHFCMRSPEGVDHWCKGVFVEIDEPARLVYTDFFVDTKGERVEASYYGLGEGWPLETLVTVTFDDVAEGKTELTLTHAVGQAPADHRNGAQQGWSESFASRST